MTDTPEQTQYDADFAAFLAADPASRPRLKAALDAKYPDGRPADVVPPPPPVAPVYTVEEYDAAFAAFNAAMAAADAPSRVRIKAAFDAKYPDGRPGSKPPKKDPDMSGFYNKIGFILTKALTEDPVYGVGERGLKAVYDLWFAGDETAAVNLYFQTDYFLKLGKTAASRYALSKNQPEVYAADVAAYVATQKKRLGLVGVKIDDADLLLLLKEAYAGNLNDAQLDSSIVQSASFGTTFGGTILSQTEGFRKYARSYGISYTDEKFSQWGRDLFAGRITDSEVEKAIQDESASAYPAFADQIKNGVTLDALSSAYKSSMASILEIDADSIGYGDSTLRKALQHIGADGKPASKPLWEYEQDLRADVRWQFTNNARDSVDSLQYKVMKDWGLM